MKILRWVLIAVLCYMTALLLLGTEFIFVDNFNLVMHEAGHIVLMLFGSTISFLGGTLFQLAIPIICAVALVRTQSDWFGGGVCGWWVGENMVNIGRYMMDAPYQRLQLIGGEHDWAYLFELWDLMNQAESIGKFVSTLGVLVMAIALGFLVLHLARHTLIKR